MVHCWLKFSSNSRANSFAWIRLWIFIKFKNKRNSWRTCHIRRLLQDKNVVAGSLKIFWKWRLLIWICSRNGNDGYYGNFGQSKRVLVHKKVLLRNKKRRMETFLVRLAPVLFLVGSITEAKSSTQYADILSGYLPIMVAPAAKQEICLLTILLWTRGMQPWQQKSKLVTSSCGKRKMKKFWKDFEKFLGWNFSPRQKVWNTQ